MEDEQSQAAPSIYWSDVEVRLDGRPLSPVTIAATEVQLRAWLGESPATAAERVRLWMLSHWKSFGPGRVTVHGPDGEEIDDASGVEWTFSDMSFLRAGLSENLCSPPRLARQSP